MARPPREELRMVERFIPPDEMVMFTEALEEERALMSRLDAISCEMVRKVRTPRTDALMETRHMP
jgi:hypothetical protein